MTFTSPVHLCGSGLSGVGSIVPAILCGGSGSRLWPMSRKEFAKQHVPILGGASPFQRALARLTGDLFAEPIVVTSAESRFLVADQALDLGLELQIALEPQARDTLAAVTLAACLAARRDPEAIVLVVPSDHLIPDVEAFHAAVAKAASAGAGRADRRARGGPDLALHGVRVHRDGRTDRPGGARGRPFCREAGRGTGRGADR